MSNRKRERFGIAALGLVILALASVASAGVGITEFINNPEGEDSGREWIEMFNYGPDPITMNGWTIQDADTDMFAIPDGTTIPVGGYLVFVSGASDLTEAQAKAVFEREWLDGAVDSRVIGMTGIAIGNSTDELILKDNGTTVWNIAYDNDENDNATWLTVDDFSRTDWGVKDGPVINRSGDDLGIPGLVGYERNETLWGDPLDPSDDTFAYASDFEAIKDAGFLTSIGVDPMFYDNVDNGSWGSPLLGIYTPEPASLLLLAAGVLIVGRRH